MSHDNLAQQLHDKVTRGRALSAAEQAQLDSWYAQQDQEESASLVVTSPPQSLEELYLLARYRDVVTLLEQVHQQHRLLLTEHRALLEEQRAVLKLLLKSKE